MEWRDTCLHSSRCTGTNNEEDSNWNLICIVMCRTAMRFVYFGFSRCYIVGMWTDVQLWEKWMLSATDNLSSFVEIHSKVGDRRPCCGRLRSTLPGRHRRRTDHPLVWSAQIRDDGHAPNSDWRIFAHICANMCIIRIIPHFPQLLGHPLL